jgi:hypothetical protein
MPPAIGRLAFSMGFTIFLLALVTLPFLDPNSAEFVVDLIALGLSAAFVGLIIWRVRRAADLPIPHDDASAITQQPYDNHANSKETL